MQYSDFEKKLLDSKNKKVLLGFSGGADSCALFLILAYWQSRIPFDLYAVHFEHGLRGNDSLQDADFCRKTAAKFGVKFLQYHLNVLDNMLKNEPMEAAARRLRLEKWQEICQNMTGFEIHLAHHANDLTENIFLRLFRGANVSGLSGLRETSELHGMKIRRVLLDFSRRDIEQFLKDENFNDYCIDKSNLDCSIGRNCLRNRILKDIENFFPYAFKGILRSAEVCEIDADFIEQNADLKFAEIANDENVANEFYQQLHPALRIRVLRLYLSSKLQYEYIPDWNFMQRFSDMLSQKSGMSEQKIELDREYFYIRRNGSWHIGKKGNVVPDTVCWDWQNESAVQFGGYIYRAAAADKIGNAEGKFYFDADKLSSILQITSRQDGDRFEKFGGGHTSVKKELTNHKIYGGERDGVGILRNGTGEIMLVGGFRRSAFAPICCKNHKIIEISVEKFKK